MKKQAHAAPLKSQRKTHRPRPASLGPLYATRADVMLVAEDIAMRRDLDREWVRSTIGQAHLIPAIVRASTPAAVGTAKNWTLYRSRVVEPVRIEAGVKFWQDNREALERAERETGVPATIIVGIIGIESIYGQQTGNYRVIDALCTLAFDFPAEHPRARTRAAFFLSELEAFLSLTHLSGADPLALRGSYAGAMGMPQFMPSSWRNYAVDFDGDGRIDLFHSPADVIGSVANYFKAHNWQAGLPTHYGVRLSAQGPDKASLLKPDIVPTFAPAAFAALGGELGPAALQHPGLLALVELQNGSAPPVYVAGTENFYAITRYNWSSYYALAVVELGQAVAEARATHAAAPSASAVPK